MNTYINGGKHERNSSRHKHRPSSAKRGSSGKRAERPRKLPTSNEGGVGGEGDDDLEDGRRLTLEQQRKIQLLKKRFGNLGISAKYYLLLDDMKNEVMPQKHYTCPVDWEEYSNVSRTSLEDAQVMWIKKNGNFCLPPDTKEPVVNKVESIEHLEQNVEAAETEEKEHEEKVNAPIPPVPISKLSASKLVKELQGLNTQMDAALNPEKGYNQEQERRKQEQEETKRLARLQHLHALKEEEDIKQQRNADIAELEDIMSKMPSYEALDSVALRRKAEEYYTIASSCAVQVVDGKKQTHDQHMTQCAASNDCAVMNDVCVPDQIFADVKSDLSSVVSDASSGISTMSVDETHKQAITDLAQWWQKFYTKSLNETELNNEEQTLLARSLLTGKQ